MFSFSFCSSLIFVEEKVLRNLSMNLPVKDFIFFYLGMLNFIMSVYLLIVLFTLWRPKLDLFGLDKNSFGPFFLSSFPSEEELPIFAPAEKSLEPNVRILLKVLEFIRNIDSAWLFSSLLWPPLELSERSKLFYSEADLDDLQLNSKS